MKRCALLCAIASLAFVSAAASLTNGGFESGLEGWRWWTRDKEAGSVTIDTRLPGGGRQSARLEHHGENDWSFEPQLVLDSKPGGLYELEVSLRIEGDGAVTLCASTWDGAHKALDWSYSERSSSPGPEWQKLRTRVLVPEGVVQVQPRLLGYGKVKAWVDDFSVRKVNGPGLVRNPALPSTLCLTNRFVTLTLDTISGTLSVRDHRSKRTWSQRVHAQGMVLSDASADKHELSVRLFHGTSGLEISGFVQLDDERPEFTLDLKASGELTSALRFPHPFDTRPGDSLVIPMNEGISYPIDDATIPLHRLISYGGHGICMPFWGVTDANAGHMAIFETPDDAAIQVTRIDGRLMVAPEWDPQRRTFGYTRRLRYVFFDQGGHVAIAKRYRNYAKGAGLLKTLVEKCQENPNVDLLIGAVNVWCWDRNSDDIVKEMQAAGIKRILWSNRGTPEKLRILNDLGVLTSRYDIYQDAMNPAEFPRLGWLHPDWTTNAWPKDIITGVGATRIKGWGVEAKDGSMVHCGVICDKQALPYARERVPVELETHPYKARFIDTTTAAPWQECFDPAHPMTRTESREHKMSLLNYMSRDMKLVTGCETGHDAAVPFLHYFEGMLSLGPYRVPDSGRRMNVIWTNVPAVVAKFQLGHAYRLPLWELVYHDCVVSQWYWGDYNNKLPALWDKRDLFNLLYGTPPMFMFDRKLWSENKDRFVQSYQTTCAYVRELGYAEMTNHLFLTWDRSVQQTAFTSGHTITVNFGSSPFTTDNGNTLKPLAFSVARKGG